MSRVVRQSSAAAYLHKQNLRILVELQDHGIPVFHCVLRGFRDERGELLEAGRPAGWQKTQPDHYRVSEAPPGSAFCVVTGRGLDVLDVDTKNGADLDGLREMIMDAGVMVVASVETPSGGWHYYIPSTGYKSQTGIIPGVDYLGGDEQGQGRMHAFAPGTVRPKYPQGVYRWVTAPDLSSMGERVDVTRDFIRSLRGKSESVRIREAKGISVVHDLSSVTDLSSAQEVVMNSTEGTRNNTLYLVAARLSNLGLTDVADFQGLVTAGVTHGLSRSEAEKTVTSAFATGSRRRAQAFYWGEQVHSSDLMHESRTKSMANTVMALVDLFTLHGSTGVGISCRDLAEVINFTHQTASKQLHRLVEAGLLVKELSATGVSPMHSDVYSIPEEFRLGDRESQDSQGKATGGETSRPVPRSTRGIPSPPNVDTQTYSYRESGTSGTSLSAECQLSGAFEDRVRQVHAHSAFTRARGEVSLPPGAADTMVAIEIGDQTVGEISQRTGSSKNTVRRHLNILESAGFISCETHNRKRVWPIWSTDLTDALDEWCEHLGIEDRPERLRKKHAEQRRYYRTEVK